MNHTPYSTSKVQGNVTFRLTSPGVTNLGSIYLCAIHQMRWFTWVWCNYPLGADTQRLHQAGVSLSEQGGGGGGARGAGGELSSGGRRGDGQGHGAGLLLHPLDATQSHMSACYISVVSQKRLCSLLFSFATHLLTPKYCGLWFLLFITNYFINFWVFCTHW